MNKTNLEVSESRFILHTNSAIKFLDDCKVNFIKVLVVMLASQCQLDHCTVQFRLEQGQETQGFRQFHYDLLEGKLYGSKITFRDDEIFIRQVAQIIVIKKFLEIKESCYYKALKLLHPKLASQ